jgi:peptidoglycan/xylan/chitin deacetylase (PgdA/CDA1 family)
MRMWRSVGTGAQTPGRGRRAVGAILGVLLAGGLAACAPSGRTSQAQWDPPQPSLTPSTVGTPSPTPPPLPPALAAKLPVFASPPPPDPVTEPPSTNAAWFSAIPTKQQVAFLTIDDGFTKDPELVDVLRASHIRVTLFLEINAIKDDPAYFRQLVDAGAVIEAHTITHPNLVGMSYAAQEHEICGSADQLAKLYGQRPVLFRPPYGDKDSTTLRVTHDCGMKAAFMWKETINAGIVRYQVGNKVRPGDIMLMHFRPTVVQDFLAGLQAIHDAGLTPALLEDYIGGSPPPVNPGGHPPPTPSSTPVPTPTASAPPAGDDDIPPA